MAMWLLSAGGLCPRGGGGGRCQLFMYNLFICIRKKRGAFDRGGLLVRGTNCHGADVRGGGCPRGAFVRGQLSGGRLSRGKLAGYP